MRFEGRLNWGGKESLGTEKTRDAKVRVLSPEDINFHVAEPDVKSKNDQR